MTDLRTQLSRDLRHRIRPLRGRDPGERLTRSSELTVLVSVIVLVALCSVVEVVGHEIVAYRHTLRVVEQET